MDERSALTSAYNAVHGDRNADYGHPADDFECQAAIVTAILRRRGVLKPGAAVTAADIPLMMQATKISRECHRPKRDNRVDGAGYWEALEMVRQREAGAA